MLARVLPFLALAPLALAVGHLAPAHGALPLEPEVESAQITAVIRARDLLARKRARRPAASRPVGFGSLLLPQGSACLPSWLPTSGGQSGTSDTVYALTVFDDGGGPALFVAGEFTIVGGVAMNYVAKWDGSSWTVLGSGMNSDVRALTVFDDGGGPALYAGGRFTTASGVVTNRIAKWDGLRWAALDGGMNHTVSALAVFDDGGGPALYAGGSFTTASGVAASGIAKWDGSSWTALGGGMSNSVYALAMFDDGGGPALYAGGLFKVAGGTAANYVAKWDGSSWTALGSGMNSVVWALASFNDGGGPALYAGGMFTGTGSMATNRIAKWNGSKWAALGSGMNNVVSALAVFDDGGGPALFVGGSFGTSTSGDSYLAKWGCAVGSPVAYCTAGTSGSGCQAVLCASGVPSATAASGFTLSAATVEGAQDSLFFFGTNGRQANPWGNGTSYQCVVPPVVRAGLLTGSGNSGLCDGSFSQDLNALWCPSCLKPFKNPGAGTTVQAQLWCRDSFSSSNQTTSLSDAIEFWVGP